MWDCELSLNTEDRKRTTLAPIHGMGMWIVNLHSIGSTQHIIDTCKTHNIEWLAIRSGGADLSGQLDLTSLHLIQAAGIPVLTWNYSVPKTIDRQVVQLQKLHAMGVAGHLIDAEIEWDMGDFEDAKQLVDKVRAAVPDMWVGHCPWWLPKAHPYFPWTEFGTLDCIMPQLYWTMLPAAQGGAKYMWDRSMADYARYPFQLAPIGSCFHGNMMNGVVNGQDCKAEEVDWFLTQCEMDPNIPYWSLYSWDSCPQAVWDILASRQMHLLLDDNPYTG